MSRSPTGRFCRDPDNVPPAAAIVGARNCLLHNEARATETTLESPTLRARFISTCESMLSVDDPSDVLLVRKTESIGLRKELAVIE